ncbi:MAG: phosphatase PAP2 family protein [Pseudolabrys sp.]
MNRTGLLIVVAVAAVTGILFGVVPQIDIAISRWAIAQFRSGLSQTDATEVIAREAISWLIAAIAAPAFVAIAVKLALPRRPMLIPSRPAVFLIATIALGPGLLTNIILKDHWGRYRPNAVAEFGGLEKFSAWWDPRGGCSGNCSFVAGEPSGAFWTLAPAALTPPPWRPLAYAAAIGFGAAVGILRMAFGAHFFSDVVFAGVLTFLVIWTMHGLLYRWRRTRLSDATLEREIARPAMSIQNFFGRRFGGKKRA